MKLDQSPSFRKAVTPWHDSKLFCAIISLLMALVFFFGDIGARFALEHEEYRAYRWVPLVLMVLSGVVLAVNLTRLLVHIIRRPPENDE